MGSLYEILKTSKMGAGAAPDLYTALFAQQLADKTKEYEMTGVPPLEFVSDGSYLSDWVIKGNTVQNGTPTPQNPIQPSECGERTGNLFDGALLSGFYKNASFDLDTSGGTVYKSIKVYLVAGTYTVSFEHNVNIVRQILDGIYSENIGSNIDSYTFTTTTDTYFGISFRLSQSSSTSWDNSNIMLNTGSQPLPYEPYGIKIPILSNSTTTNVYLGEVQSTRQIKKLVLDGSENWDVVGMQNIYGVSVSNSPIAAYTAQICTHYTAGSSWNDVVSNDNRFGISSPQNQLVVHYNSAGSTTNFKAYLAQQYANGTPVCVWYVLATPTTGIVNEPLRKIGTYADEVSGITIPVTAGENAIDVDTTLKPSEVSVNYHGWHPVQSVHERENGAWD